MCGVLGYCGTRGEYEQIRAALAETTSRGPDETVLMNTGNGWLGFNRLSIMGLTPDGMQPFLYGKKRTLRRTARTLPEQESNAVTQSPDPEWEISLVCNGEIYGFRPMKEELAAKGYSFISDSDCEILPAMYMEYGTDMFRMLDAEFALILYDRKDDLQQTFENIHELLFQGVRKRLDSDTPIGFLLSGGLDSSLVCGIAATILDKPLETWAIGMDVDAIDLKYARQVAEYIGSNHHEIIITKEDVLDALDAVIHALGSYDITTIRASVGMYLVCKAIHSQSDIRVILTGEISDEIFGYKYTDFAPSAEEFQKEAQKRIREIHMYDVLRADRCISVNSLEARVPFGDLDFVEYCMSIDPEKKRNHYGKGKYLLRKAFEKDRLIPESILWREKAAFSDAVGHSLKDDIVQFAEETYSDEAYAAGIQKYHHARPFTKESLLYRDIFEKHYPGQSEMIADFWMPNRNWEGCNVTDPSARVLSNYGDSGK